MLTRARDTECQCECSGGSAVSNGGSEQTAGTTAMAEAGMAQETAAVVAALVTAEAGMAQETAAVTRVSLWGGGGGGI